VPTLIDQSFFLNGSPSMTHNVINPSQSGFLEHAESQFDIDNPIFDDYFFVLELNVSTNLSFVGPTQSEISDLDAQMLITKNTKCAEHNEFWISMKKSHQMYNPSPYKAQEILS
jgi:hypothetical protein